MISLGDEGNGTPDSGLVSLGETSLYRLEAAYNNVHNLSQSNLASLAGAYSASDSDFSLTSILSTIASSQNQANALVASALYNSYIDGAEDGATAAATLQQGGTTLLDALIEQATGLDAEKIVKELNNPGCSDWQTFRSTYATQVSNQVIAAAPANQGNLLYRNGIVWSSMNLNAPFSTRINQQGYPYENYVTSILGSNYIQTPASYKTFDHWNQTSGIAVSDKTLDTNGSSYSSIPSKITNQMVKYGLEMTRFVSSNQGYSPSVTQSIISSYRFQFAVPATTNAAQWQAICAGYHDLMQKVPQISGKSIQIAINYVS